MTWENLHRLEELITPRCHGCVERYDAKTLLFSSPASPYHQKEHPYGRYNMTIRLSHDDGEMWTAGKTIWPHPGSYSDLVVLNDGTIGYVYERAEKGSDHYWDELHFARFNLEWLTKLRGENSCDAPMTPWQLRSESSLTAPAGDSGAHMVARAQLGCQSCVHSGASPAGA